MPGFPFACFEQGARKSFYVEGHNRETKTTNLSLFKHNSAYGSFRVKQKNHFSE